MTLKWVRTEVPVRYVECDPMGVVHHSHYLNWFEIGRMKLAEEAGIYFRELDKEIYFPVVHIDCAYKESAKFGDVVIVETALQQPKKAYLQFSYRIFRKYGRALLAKGESEHALTYPDGRLIYRLDAEFEQKIERFLSS
ncbi:acyl-CoA thioesterase [Virgibacillus soli]|uniref:Acyl-CoA thioesterase n=1 Tax=Paracerasibacillus soli TaxID=480284 RepID=A0ABU5CSG8_9BACI|nr:acyl-CoA thioesterase [Virgibacillus soli]MDY0409190.1 acyl-CoA thioesterase [Virgibacillus soli]